MDGLTKVTIDFGTSHLLFPTIIAIVLGGLGLAILIRDRRRISKRGVHWQQTCAAIDKARFFGTITLTLIYFSLMMPVGLVWPNTGMGFLICSIPYVLLTGILFMHQRTFRRIVPVAITAIAAPALLWWLFARIFFLSLP